MSHNDSLGLCVLDDAQDHDLLQALIHVTTGNSEDVDGVVLFLCSGLAALAISSLVGSRQQGLRLLAWPLLHLQHHVLACGLVNKTHTRTTSGNW